MFRIIAAALLLAAPAQAQVYHHQYNQYGGQGWGTFSTPSGRYRYHQQQVGPNRYGTFTTPNGDRIRCNTYSYGYGSSTTCR